MKIEVTDLAGLLRLALDDFAAKTHTAIPGAIVSYTAASKQASVQPLVQKRIWQDGQLTAIPLPVIYDVPVQFPGTSRAQISFDLQKGDTGMIVFSEASLDAWLQGSGAQTDPQDDRRFNLNDAIFVPGVSPFGAPGIPGVSSGLLLQYGSGGSPAQILLKPDGTMELNGNTLRFVTYDALNSALQTFLTALKAAVAAGCSSGTGGTLGALALDISGSKSTTLKTGG